MKVNIFGEEVVFNGAIRASDCMRAYAHMYTHEHDIKRKLAWCFRHNNTYILRILVRVDDVERDEYRAAVRS